jgi:hypothetical protein
MYALHWAVANGSITLGIEAAAGDGWVGFGLSDTGSMKGADITTITKTAGGTWQATDMHAIGFQRPLRDTQQDVVLLSAQSTANGKTVAVFKRPLVSCDTLNDLILEDGMPQIVIWAIGQGPELSYHGNTRGAAQVDFRPVATNATASNATSGAMSAGAATVEPVRTLNITYDKQVVPGKETTYMCKYIQFPTDTKYHAVSYEGIITSKFMHHMVLYRCASAPVNVSADVRAGQPFDCTDSGSPCMEYAMVWAPGTPRTAFPPEAGLPFGESQETSWFVLNAHYNNPDGIEGGTDSSGFSIKYTSALRPQDMGVLTLGTTNLNIPPGLANFTAPPSRCPSACTRRITQPLNLWANYLHMHQTGDAMKTQLLRPANASVFGNVTAGSKSTQLLQEQQPIGVIRSYSFDFQKATPIPPASRILLPGDELVTTCGFDTRGRDYVTRFGLGSRDEMCYNFLFYYPREPVISACITYTPFTLCGSESDVNLVDFQDKSAVQAVIQSGLLIPETPQPPQYVPYKGPACTAVQQPAAPAVKAAAGNASS